MSLIPTIAEMIARVYGQDASNYALALEIVALLEQHHSDDRNHLSQMLMERTDELNRLQKFMGVEK